MDQEQIDFDTLVWPPLEEGSDYCAIHVQKLTAMIRELRGLRAQAGVMSEWQSIETAPRDGGRSCSIEAAASRR